MIDRTIPLLLCTLVSAWLLPSHFAFAACVDGRNGIQQPGEQCDPPAFGASSCCTAACTFEPTTTVCRAQAGFCDTSESCTGNSASCPAEAFKPSTTPCRSSGGICDIVENCTGNGPDCPTDMIEPPTTTCRPSTGVCDPAEECTGFGNSCPNDAISSNSTVCRASTGGCDPAEYCDGATATCAGDSLAPAFSVCRPQVGICDLGEQCDGVSSACPADQKKDTSVVCRAGTSDCDTAENCNGLDAACPTDQFASCDDGDLCTLDQCYQFTGCDHTNTPINPASCALPGKYSLSMKDTGTPEKNAIKWAWKKGAAVNAADLGTPDAMTSYALCVYDQSTSSPELVASYNVPPSSTRWSVKTGSVKYIDKAAAEAGVKQIKGKASTTPGKSKMSVKLGGATLALPPTFTGAEWFDQDPSVIVQLVNDAGACWSSSFTVPQTDSNTDTSFKATGP